LIVSVVMGARKERLSSEELGQVVPIIEKSRNSLLGARTALFHQYSDCGIGDPRER
jgi:hypothetical protein